MSRIGPPMVRPAMNFIDEERSWTSRKRQRPSIPHSQHHQDLTTPVVTSSMKRAVKIGEAAEVQEFYMQRFKDCQQNACKLIAKAWVKAVEPKKQSNHPYTRGDESAPDWWPAPWGSSMHERVRHIEPDHQKKPGVLLSCVWVDGEGTD
jgi:hypothetical protein